MQFESLEKGICYFFVSFFQAVEASLNTQGSGSLAQLSRQMFRRVSKSNQLSRKIAITCKDIHILESIDRFLDETDTILNRIDLQQCYLISLLASNSSSGENIQNPEETEQGGIPEQTDFLEILFRNIVHLAHRYDDPDKLADQVTQLVGKAATSIVVIRC